MSRLITPLDSLLSKCFHLLQGHLSVEGENQMLAIDQTNHASCLVHLPGCVTLKVLCPEPLLSTSEGLQCDSSDRYVLWIRKSLVLGLKNQLHSPHHNRFFQTHARTQCSQHISISNATQQQPYCGYCASKVRAYTHTLRGHSFIPWVRMGQVRVR